MKYAKFILLIAMTAFVAVGCGTDGLDVEQESLRITDPTPDDFPDFVFSGNSYSYTLNVENGSASEVNLTRFNDGGEWLQAQLVNDGTQIQLSGIVPDVGDDDPENDPDQEDFGFSLTAVGSDQGNGITSFEITVRK